MTNGAFWIDFQKEIFRYLGKKRINVLHSSIFPSVFPGLSWGGCRLLMILQTFLVTIIRRIPRLDEIKKNPSGLFPSWTDQAKIPSLALFDENKHLHSYSVVSSSPFLSSEKTAWTHPSGTNSPDVFWWPQVDHKSRFVKKFLFTTTASICTVLWIAEFLCCRCQNQRPCWTRESIYATCYV